jgi:HEAT repeat protein
MLSWLRRLLGGNRPPAVPPLVEQSRDPDYSVRQKAAEALGGVNELWAATALVERLGDMFEPVRVAAQASLRRLGPASVPALAAGMKHPRDQVVVQSAELLGELGAAEGVEALMGTFKFAPRELQRAALRALIRLGAVARPALEASKDDPDPWVRQHVEDLLAALNQAKPAPTPAQVGHELAASASPAGSPGQTTTQPPAVTEPAGTTSTETTQVDSSATSPTERP